MTNRRKTVISRERPKARDALCNRVAKRGMLLDKEPANEVTHPFATFSEWLSEADEKAYGGL